MRNPDLVAYLLRRCIDVPETGCLLWPAKGKLSTGYCWITYLGRVMTAHRALFFAAFGAPPADKPFVRHSCDNRRCVNPNHLFAGTHQDNMDDMRERGRSTKGRNINGGDANPNARLTHADIFEIRDATDLESVAAAKGIGVFHAKRIQERKVWRHLP